MAEAFAWVAWSGPIPLWSRPAARRGFLGEASVRVQELKLQGAGLPGELLLNAQLDNPELNWLTVIIGPNGTGKSLLLRLLTGAAVDKPTFTPPMREKLTAQITAQTGKIRRVIALSGTTNDRFPVVSGVPLSRPPTSYDIENYTYFGPKYASSIASRTRAISTMAHSMLAKLPNVQERRKEYTGILSYLQYEPIIRFRLEADRRQARGMQAFPERLKSYEMRLQRNSEPRYAELSAYIDLLKNSQEKQEQVRRFIEVDRDMIFDFHGGKNFIISNTEATEIPLTNQVGNFGRLPFLSATEIATLIEINIVDVEEVSFKRKTNAENASTNARFGRGSTDGWSDSSDLSSGQWHLITGLLNLIAWTDSESLILIDEPENSLHPEWQRSYIDLLRMSLSSVSGCHVVIATHSPLVAAGARPNEGNILRLSRDEDSNTLTTHDEPPVYGWLPGDVLQDAFGMQSARSPEIVEAANRALALVKYGGAADRQMLKQYALDLRRLSDPLPSNDPLLPALDALISLAEAGGDPDDEGRP